MNEILDALRGEYPDMAFDGGDHSEGYWIKADAPLLDWTWERSRMTSLESVMLSVREAITERLARG